jgi:hypothetical protein
MTLAAHNLWDLTRGRPQIDPDDLAEAVAVQATEENLDYRTRLLIRDSIDALRSYWGQTRLSSWLSGRAERQRIEAICKEAFERPGFPSLPRRLMEKTKPEDVKAYLRELGSHLHGPVELFIGGSVALILADWLSKKTDDIDVVDEVPEPIRTQYELLDKLQARYGIYVRHFQSHYLPSGWQSRLHSTESFGGIRAYLVDAYDVFLSKLTSMRDKDRDDLRVVMPQLDKAVLERRLKDTMAAIFADPEMKENARHNWHILFGEELPQ